MKNIVFFLKTFFVLGFFLFIVACKKDNAVEPDPEKIGVFSIEFDNIVGEETLGFDTRTYTNAKGEEFTISLLQYFISNIKLKKADGSEYIVPQDDSYFLINAADRETRFTKVSVPEGDYTSVSFIIGVDSWKSSSPIDERTGVLSFNPAEGHEGGGMYWGWNSGYIFLKFEGKCNLISDDQNGDPTGNKRFKYHIGGFGGYSAPTLNNIKEITIDLNKAGIAQVRENLRSNAHLFVDVMKIFNGSHTFSIVEHPNVMFSDYSTNIADNFKEMFTHDHTENFAQSDGDL